MKVLNFCGGRIVRVNHSKTPFQQEHTSTSINMFIFYLTDKQWCGQIFLLLLLCYGSKTLLQISDDIVNVSPFAAFLLLQGVETLSLRVERHAENTRKVVEYLANHPQVEKVNHPSLLLLCYGSKTLLQISDDIVNVLCTDRKSDGVRLNASQS